MQRVLFALLARIAMSLGYKAIEERYVTPHKRVAPDPAALRAAGLG